MPICISGIGSPGLLSLKKVVSDVVVLMQHRKTAISKKHVRMDMNATRWNTNAMRKLTVSITLTNGTASVSSCTCLRAKIGVA